MPSSEQANKKKQKSRDVIAENESSSDSSDEEPPEMRRRYNVRKLGDAKEEEKPEIFGVVTNDLPAAVTKMKNCVLSYSLRNMMLLPYAYDKLMRLNESPDLSAASVMHEAALKGKYPKWMDVSEVGYNTRATRACCW